MVLAPWNWSETISPNDVLAGDTNDTKYATQQVLKPWWVDMPSMVELSKQWEKFTTVQENIQRRQTRRPDLDFEEVMDTKNNEWSDEKRRSEVAQFAKNTYSIDATPEMLDAMIEAHNMFDGKGLFELNRWESVAKLKCLIDGWWNPKVALDLCDRWYCGLLNRAAIVWVVAFYAAWPIALELINDVLRTWSDAEMVINNLAALTAYEWLVFLYRVRSWKLQWSTSIANIRKSVNETNNVKEINALLAWTYAWLFILGDQSNDIVEYLMTMPPLSVLLWYWSLRRATNNQDKQAAASIASKQDESDL